MLSGYFPDPDYDFESDALSAFQSGTDPFLPSAASPDASQEIHPPKACRLTAPEARAAIAQQPVTGDAGNQQESHS